MPNWGSTLLGAVALALVMAVSPASAASLKVIYAFHYGEDSVGVRPIRGVIFDSGGLYGTAFRAPSGGTLFRIDTASATGELLYPIPITASGVDLYGLPALRRDNLYLSGLDATTMIYGVYRVADGGAAKPKPIHEFIEPATEGRLPNGYLLLNGSYLYGATDGGGSANIHDYVFKMDLQGNIVWKSYLSAFGGLRPIGQLVKVDGWLYGATNFGGPVNREPSSG